MRHRRQVSLYVSGWQPIDDLRHRWNPLQAALIPPHVTLIREDEAGDWQQLEARLQRTSHHRLQLGFGRAIRDGNLVYLPVIEGQQRFAELRRDLLGSGGDLVREMSPHLTLIHPRNGVCTDDIYSRILGTLGEFQVDFDEMSLIEQTGGGPWIRLASFPLCG